MVRVCCLAHDRHRRGTRATGLVKSGLAGVLWGHATSTSNAASMGRTRQAGGTGPNGRRPVSTGVTPPQQWSAL
jgi:hypothetical protein